MYQKVKSSITFCFSDISFDSCMTMYDPTIKRKKHAVNLNVYAGEKTMSHIVPQLDYTALSL